jgi:UDP-N-acetylmuramyl pentapeptide phosphotransferase/UDP-N-acetylglucosamine-1-phosphate transferase
VGEPIVIRARIELGLSAVFAALTVATFVWPTWIESLTGFEPDAGSGETEWWIVILLGLVTIALGAIGARDFRAATRLRTQRASGRP